MTESCRLITTEQYQEYLKLKEEHKPLSWDELKEEAKKMGYEKQKDYGGKSFGKDGIVFCADGFVNVYYDDLCRILKTDCSYENMLAIMKALQ